MCAFLLVSRVRLVVRRKLLLHESCSPVWLHSASDMAQCPSLRFMCCLLACSSIGIVLYVHGARLSLGPRSGYVCVWGEAESWPTFCVYVYGVGGDNEL